ncbi:MAG: NUDIX hydrolase [bacterium]
MANSELYDKEYEIPRNILKQINSAVIKYPNSNGIKRAKHLLKNGVVTYQSLKRLKNYFDYVNTKDSQYELAGGDLMKRFVETTLEDDRDAVNRSNMVKQDINNNLSVTDKPFRPNPNLNENNEVNLNKNAIAVIVNDDNKILLLKRSDYEDQWMPNKWSLVGGAIEKGETPEKACSREIKEETNLDINDFISSFKIQRNQDSVEHIFACKYNGEPTDIILNNENSSYGWFDVNEMKFLDKVPHLIEYITLVFKKYD